MHWRELTKPHGEMKKVNVCLLICNLLHKAARMQGALEPLPVPGYWEVLSSHMCRRRSTRLWFTCVVATVRKENGSKSNSPPGMVRCLPPFPVSSTLQPGCCSHLFPRFGSTKHESSGTPRPLAPRRRLGYTCLSTGAVNRCIHHGRVSGPAL